MSRRGTRTDLGSALTKLVRRLDRASGGGWQNVRVTEVWSEAVGPQIAAHTGRVFLRGSELVISVDSPIWASELSAMSGLLKDRVNEGLGKETVKSVRLAVSRDVSAERRRTQREETAAKEEGGRVEPVPLTAEEVAGVSESVSAIENEDLREAAFRATVKHLEWSKSMRGAKRP